jgi:hypothetical protein
MVIKRFLACALGGFLAAVAVDIDAWRRSAAEGVVPVFDWKLAVQRWLNGALAGALAGLGLAAESA